jgi:hypothetical protein
MYLLDFLLNFSVNTFFDHVNMFLGADPDLSECGIIALLALDASGFGNISEALLAASRKWHGNIDDQFSAVDNLLNRVTGHQPPWTMPPEILTPLTNNRDELKPLIAKCKTTAASSDERSHRNVLLKATVSICVTQVKLWAYGLYSGGMMTAEDVHSIGFLLPGETGGHHVRAEATDVLAEVKATTINADFVRVVIDQSAGENAAQVVHGWPSGVRNAVIVIMDADTKTEALRLHTARLHNDIRMPEGSRGKQFIIKAAFLKHVDDVPKFGNMPTFSMPLTTEELGSK